MNNPLPCAVVRDLLPSYIEGLTEEETNAAVAAHLAVCPDCKAKYAAMTAPQRAAETAETEKEVDFLKTVRRRNRKRVLLAMVLVLVLTLGGVAAKIFLIGSPSKGSGVSTDAALSPEGTTLALQFTNFNSGTALFGWHTEQVDDVVFITAREAVVSPLRKNQEPSISVDLAGVREIQVFGQVIWQEGVFIQPDTLSLLAAKLPYVGDASGVGKLLGRLQLLGQSNHYTLPPYTMELQTAAQPYGLTLHFQEQLSPHAQQWARTSAYLLLSLVGNLEEVRWTWPTEDHQQMESDSLTLEAANASLPAMVQTYNETWLLQEEVPLLESVKTYSETPARMQQFWSMLN